MLLQEGQVTPVGCGVSIVDELTTIYMPLRCGVWCGVPWVGALPAWGGVPRAVGGAHQA